MVKHGRFLDSITGRSLSNIPERSQQRMPEEGYASKSLKICSGELNIDSEFAPKR